MLDRDSVDHPEPVPGEELHLEGQAEHSSYADGLRALEQLLEQEMTDSFTLDRGIDGERTDFGEVLPHHVQRAATNHVAGRPLCDQELLHVLVERDRGL